MTLWPFVSRKLYDAAIQVRVDYENFLSVIIDGERRNAAAERERLTAAIELERKRGDELLEVVLNMRMTGATVTRVIAPEGRLAKRKRSDIDQAIDENRLAGSNPALRAHLSRWASKELAKGVPLAVVLDRLRTWSAVKDEDIDEDDEENDVVEQPTDEAIAL